MNTISEKIQQFTLSVYSENTPGVLYRLANLFLKRKININSLTVSESEKVGFARFTITVDTTQAKAELICRQITKIIEVSKATCYEDKHMFFKELAIFKFEVKKTEVKAFKEMVDEMHAHIEEAENGIYFVTMANSESRIDEFKQRHKAFKLLEFARSGRIAITKRSNTK